MRMSFINSLMAFNTRVLSLGKVEPNEIYTMEELRDRLSFNRIFISNMEEIFQRHPWEKILDDYIDELSIYIHNIKGIINHINKTDPTIRIEFGESFEQRFVTGNRIFNQIISHPMSIRTGEKYNFLNGIIYYIGISENDFISISHIDPKQSIYSGTMSYDFDGYTKYWKTDECIRSYIQMTENVKEIISIRVTSSMKGSNDVVKVEYNGNSEGVQHLLGLFPRNALVINNPFIYTDDINRIIDSKIDSSVQIQQESEDIDFEKIFEKDRLFEYPTTSFDVYLRFLTLASRDKRVHSIHVSLYRIGSNPEIYYILRDAVNRGIHVHVNLELYASGEYINQIWMREMQDVGIHVTNYECGKLKVHCKLTLVRFKNGRQIAQIGTGNYHSQTTSQYTDLSLMTSDKSICNQIKDVFNIFNGESIQESFHNDLLITKYNAKKQLLKLISRETELGHQGYIAIKCNSFDDEEFRKALDKAANKGCMIDLVVRGVCTWIPDQIGENVRIKSIIWDKLEHSRVFCFGKINPTMYIGSLDLVTNKINKRIEVLAQIKDPVILEEVCKYMNRHIVNTKNSWELLRSGEYRREV